MSKHVSKHLKLAVESPIHKHTTKTKNTSPTKTSYIEKKQDKQPKERRRHIQIEYEEPDNWKETYELIKHQRATITAPVDTMGCDALAGNNESAAVRRYQTLISLMLSSQTRDEMTARAMSNLRKHGLTPENIVATSSEKLSELIRPVGFYKRKAVYIKETTETLLKEYDGDIPTTVEEMIKLKGVGPKMAYLTANCAWGTNFGIGVDIHVHRICNRLGWVDSKNPEQTRKALESWLPKDKWNDVNYMLVGFGQTICKSTPKCERCEVNHLCPSSTIKPKVKPEPEEIKSETTL